MTIRTAHNEVAVRGQALSEPVFWMGRQWAVTSYGLECRDGTYVVEADRLWENEQFGGWHRQIGAKLWADIPDLEAALAFARQHFAHLKPAKVA